MGWQLWSDWNMTWSWTRSLCFCSADEKQIESKRCIGTARDIRQRHLKALNDFLFLSAFAEQTAVDYFAHRDPLQCTLHTFPSAHVTGKVEALRDIAPPLLGHLRTTKRLLRIQMQVRAGNKSSSASTTYSGHPSRLLFSNALSCCRRPWPLCFQKLCGPSPAVQAWTDTG